MNFVPLFLLNEINILKSLLMIQLKCTVVHYANLNSSSINKPVLKYESLNMLFRFFRFLIYIYFNEAFFKNFMKSTLIFEYKFPQFISRCSISQNTMISSLAILKWQHFEYKAKF